MTRISANPLVRYRLIALILFMISAIAAWQYYAPKTQGYIVSADVRSGKTTAVGGTPACDCTVPFTECGCSIIVPK